MGPFSVRSQSGTKASIIRPLCERALNAGRALNGGLLHGTS